MALQRGLESLLFFDLYSHVIGFDIDGDSLEIASENADDLEVSSLLECNSVNCYIVVPLWYLRKYEDIVYRIWLKWEFTYDAHEFS